MQNKPNIPILALIVPCYNEEAIIQQTYITLAQKLIQLISQAKIHKNSFLCFVDDGSRDDTYSLLKKIVSTKIKKLRQTNHIKTNCPPPNQYRHFKAF